MTKRTLSSTANEILALEREQLLSAIKANEGRTVMAECVCYVTPRVEFDVTNAEFATAMSADLILLNGLDLFNFKIENLPENEDPINLLRELCGRPVGINIEPVDLAAELLESRAETSLGKQASKETFQRAEDLGFDFICLTGNPGSGVSNKAINQAVSLAKQYYSGIIVAGKMHGAGVNEEIIDLNAIRNFISSGTDIVLLPAVGTVPGVTLEMVLEATKLIKREGKLSLVANGTSQDSASEDTIKQLAIINKMAGADIHHIGDSGAGGVAPYRNIMALSIAIRGERHTLTLMAKSLNR